MHDARLAPRPGKETEPVADIFTMENLLALLTLTTMEIVLGIDNVVFIAILSARLEPSKRNRARRIGLALAMVVRVLLLLGLQWVSKLTKPLFHLVGHDFAGRHLIFIVGGLFLIAKATYEIHHKIQDHEATAEGVTKYASMRSIIIQIILLDIVFSLDSVIPAVGMARALWVMITAVVLAVVVMLLFAGKIGDFIERHPTFKMLALSFLLLIGVMLLAEGFERHIEKGYVYFAMAFALGVELLNLRVRKARAPGPEQG
ncbi:MAG: TerC family protein [Deltaproteobacteria bacterium]|nr:TerC family protein [Deltaproteobacteria bacterium]